MVEQYFSQMWKQHYQVSEKIDYFNLKSDLANQPIYVLDEDPIMCARALTTEHIKKYIEYIVYSMIIYRGTETAKKKSEAEKKPRVDYMFYNQRTAYWFYNLYKEMQEIYKKATGKYYKVSEYFQDTWLNNLSNIQGPKDVVRRQYRGAHLPSEICIREKYHDIYTHYKSTINKVYGRTNKFRVMYMIMGYLNNEFPLGAPVWYSCMKTTIWKSFNKMTRLYYRIDTTIEGQYSYYYSVDNKNWIEIQNIPFDMRGLIDGIIFAREV